MHINASMVLLQTIFLNARIESVWDEVSKESSSQGLLWPSEPKIQGRVTLWLATHPAFLPPELSAHKTGES